MSENTRQPKSRVAGELRRLIAEMGYSWVVDPRLRDTDPLPKYARGGKRARSAPEATAVTGELADFLRQRPPSNPFLRARWVDLQLLPADSQQGTGGSSPGIVSFAGKDQP
jgi:hypothetical protein